MGILFSSYAALGRLYDPLPQLAESIHRGMSGKRQLIWADEKGRVFANDPGYVQSSTPRSIIGMYDAYTSPTVIETDLRRGLRERASSWILDWTSQASIRLRSESRAISPPPKSRRRSRKQKKDAHADIPAPASSDG